MKGSKARCLVAFSVIFLLSNPIQAKSLESGFLPWLRLLHFHGPKSSINAPEFFLSPIGSQDPEAEWKALEAADPRDVACRFPARVLIHERLTGQAWPAAPCEDFLEWKEGLSFRSLSLVYSTAYAGNPASILGHNILKINRQEDQPLLDYGLAFMARNNPSDGPVFYVLNGLFGGYPGFFTLQPYYELVNTYAYAENRDLWELEIDLSEAERALFLAHVWELIHLASADYYFTHVNCSTMLLEVLDAIRPEWNLRAAFPRVVLPQAVMRAVAEKESEHREHFWPSQKRIFQQRWDGLNPAQKEKLLHWKSDGDLLAVADDADVLDAIIDHFNLRKSKLDLPQQMALRVEENQLLLARAQLPSSMQVLPGKNSAENNPLWAHGPHKLSLLAGREGTAAVLGTRIRYGLHDLLDEPRGFNPFYHINFFDLSLWKTDTLSYQFELVDLLSLNPYQSVDPAASWAVTFGARDGQLHLDGAYGLSWELQPQRSLVYAMPAAELQLQHADVGLRIGWFQSWTARWRQLVEWHPRYDRSWQMDWSWEQRLSLPGDWQLEGKIAREKQLSVLGGIGQFF